MSEGDELTKLFLDVLKVQGWRIRASRDAFPNADLHADSFISHREVAGDQPFALDIKFFKAGEKLDQDPWHIIDATEGTGIPYLIAFVERGDVSSSVLIHWMLVARNTHWNFALRPPELAERLNSLLDSQEAEAVQTEAPDDSPTIELQHPILELLQADGWTVAAPRRDPGIPIDAEIFRDDLLFGRRFWLLIVKDRRKVSGFDDDVLRNIVNSLGQDFLVVLPPEKDSDTGAVNESLTWLVFSRDSSFELISSAHRLRSELANKLNTRYLYALRYDADDVDQAPWVGDAVPDSTVLWAEKDSRLPRDARPGDALIFLRALNAKEKSQSGRADLVGTGYLESTDRTRDDAGTARFPVRILQFSDENPITYKKLSQSIHSSLWDSGSSITFVQSNDVKKIDRYLLLKHWTGVFELPRQVVGVGIAEETDGAQPIGSTDTSILSNEETPREVEDVALHDDGAERDRDSLNRDALALAFAWRLHDIWCQAQGLQARHHLRPWRDTDSFVAHVDAPWGGGKSTFVNFVARVLNPHLDGRKKEDQPQFLKQLYKKRSDLSGLFLSQAHQLGGLKTDGNDYALHAKGRRPWIIVHYNAWEHEDVRPPWWCFYQVIRKSCFSAILNDGVPEVRQRSGPWWRRWLRSRGLNIRELPNGHRKAAGHYFTIWESGIKRGWRWFWLVSRELVWRVWNPEVRMRFWAALLTISIVLMIWQSGALDLEEGARANFNTATVIGLGLALIVSVGGFFWKAMRATVDILVPSHTENGEQASLGPGDPMGRFRKHFGNIIRQLQRPVLVVIDDIDRCNHETVVDLFRGIQTILQSRRVFYLILGDRQWIERSFEASHPEMRTIDVGTEHTFGGRFVEKAIQLSYVLPGMSDEVRRSYLREMLLGKSATADETSAADEYRSKVRAEFSEAESIEEIEQKAEALEKETDSSTDGQQQQIRGQERALRQASQRDAITEKTAHRLLPLAPHLPRNPREIKRIVNTIAMYHESLTVTDTEDAADIGDERWRQLAIGVVLMMRFPQSWARLVTDAERLPAGNSYEDDQPEESDQQLDLKDYPPEFVALMRSTNFREEGHEVKTVIDAVDGPLAAPADPGGRA